MSATNKLFTEWRKFFPVQVIAFTNFKKYMQLHCKRKPWLRFFIYINFKAISLSCNRFWARGSSLIYSHVLGLKNRLIDHIIRRENIKFIFEKSNCMYFWVRKCNNWRSPQSEIPHPSLTGNLINIICNNVMIRNYKLIWNIMINFLVFKYFTKCDVMCNRAT